jgi:NAD-reducing hydrogenase small subunit
MNPKTRLATVWLDGCSGCHMSLLDLDHRVLDFAGAVELVYSPLMDAKEFPRDVDVVLIEGAVGTDDDLRTLHLIREHSKVLVSLGDCAVTANVPSMRNRFDAGAVLGRAYIENADGNAQIPRDDLPALRRRVLPLHQFVKVDVYIPGCPPPADAIHFALTELVAGRLPDFGAGSRFG